VTLVADASVVVAALVDTGPAGQWAEALLASDDLAAPHLMLVEVRSTITAYDAWYVALAEALGAPLATLDLALSRVAGPRCEFATPPSAPLGRPRQPDS
jgi:predicted nucleic acid-binding protein